jgi:hypothetical protein
MTEEEMRIVDSTLTDRQILEEVAIVNFVNPSLPTRELIHAIVSDAIHIALFFDDHGIDKEEHF